MTQTTVDARQLLADAQRVHSLYDTFIKTLARKSGGRYISAKLKGMYRYLSCAPCPGAAYSTPHASAFSISEKMYLRSKEEQNKYPGASKGLEPTHLPILLPNTRVYGCPHVAAWSRHAIDSPQCATSYVGPLSIHP